MREVNGVYVTKQDEVARALRELSRQIVIAVKDIHEKLEELEERIEALE